MNIRKKVVGTKSYYILEHSLREGNKIVKKEHYLGAEIPKNIQYLKNEFMYSILNEKYFHCFEKIKKNFNQELRSMPPSAQEKYLNYFLIKFTYDTNRIEGSTITLKETAKILDQGITPQNKPLNDVKETGAHKKAFQEMISYKKELSLQVILQWHKILFQETHPDIAGRWRTHGVKVAGSKTEFPLPIELDTLLREFIAWYHQAKEKVNHLELAALVHLKFVSIHPFSDGNGRISRLLMNFILHHHGYPMLNIKYTNRDGYYHALEQAQVKKQEKIFILHLFRRYLKEYNKYI